MDIQSVKLSDIVDFRPRELSNEEWSQIESREGVRELRRPLEEARLPGGWAGLRNKMPLDLPGTIDLGEGLGI